LQERGEWGEVYRAKDKRLDRTVAIKVLPSHLSSSSDLKQRFEREAKAISNLNHPHICALYDVGQQDGVEFLIMEFLDGETLAARLKKGMIPLPQALTLSTQIADALLFSGEFGADPFYVTYDVHPDGKRFVMWQPTTSTATTHLQFISNWFTEPPKDH
jgi:serine/threonine protein kinase